MNYNNHEALFLTWEEKQILMDLFEKAYQEYEKEKNYAQGNHCFLCFTDTFLCGKLL